MLTFGDDESERVLAAFWDGYVDEGRRGLRHALAHAGASWSAFRAVRRLPRLEAAPTGSAGGRAVRRVLASRASYGIPARLLGTAALEVPADPDDYLAGRRAQTLRRRIRSAERRGLKVRRVEERSERHDLVAMANRAEQSHVDPAYRVPTPHNDDLLDHDLWLTVEDPEGRVLLLAVTPVDGELATLRYFRTLGSGDAHSDARYLATGALVAELAALGVRYLLDTATPAEQTNGLRHFQRMVGFRYVRFRLRRRPAPSPRRAPGGR
jgi:hypothetical protein